MSDEEFGKFVSSKPLIFWPSVIVLVLGLLYMVYLGIINVNSGNLFENIDYLRQKMAPAFNETTGFLVISYAVIICIGNVIMKTSPKYLASGGESQEEKTTGFVAWLQSKGLGWLPIFISVTVVSLMTFLPINNKILKIGIIAIVLSGTIVAALFFNAIIKLFGGKESFTNVKEEFGHMKDGKKHPFKIAVGTSPISDEKPDVVYFRYDNSEEDHIKDSRHYQFAGNPDGATTNFGISNSSNIEIDNEFFNNQLTIGLHEGKEQDADIYYSEFPWGSPGGETTLKKIKEPLTITVESESKTIYFHSFKKGTLIFKSKPTIAGDTKYNLDDNDIAYIDTSGKEPMTDKEYCVWEQHNDDKKLKTGSTDNVKSIVFWGGDKNKLKDYITDSSLPLGVVINLKNMEQFFGFDVGAVKKSVSDSYIAYYCLVWGSFLVYTIVNAIQKKKWFWFIFPIPPETLLPFMGAAIVETLLIGQSHYSLEQSDVASKQASPTFSYAVAGFATRIATVVAFISSILTQVKD